MEEGNKKSNIVLIIVIIVLALIIIIGYYYFWSKINGKCNKVNVCTIEDTASTNNKSDIPTKDLTALILFDNSLFYAYIDNGNLYYYADIEDYSDEENEPSFFPESDDMIKFTKLGGIKRIKVFNYGSGVNPQILLITDNGKSYNLSFNNKPEVEENRFLKNYEVDDVLNYECESEDCLGGEILLKDGSKKKITTLFVDE